MKQVNCVVLIVFLLTHMVPMQGMFTSVRRLPSGFSRNVSNATSRVPSGTSRTSAATQELGKRFIHGTTGPPSSWMARQAAALKSRFSRWWAGKSTISLEQKELSVPVVQQIKQSVSEVKPEAIVEKPLFVAVNQLQGSESDEDIIAKLLHPNSLIDYNNPLAQQITEFLKKNNVDAIERVFSLLINKSEGLSILSEIIRSEGPLVSAEAVRKNNFFVVKVLPLIEKYFDKIKDDDFMVTVLSRIPFDLFSLETDNLKEKFFEKISLSFLERRYPKETIYRLLPHDNKKCITTIAFIDYNVYHNMSDIEAKKFDELMQFLRNIASQKITNLTDNDLKGLIKKLYETTNSGPRLFEQLLSGNSRLQNIFVDILETDQDSGFTSWAFQSLLMTLDGQSFLKTVLGLDNSYAQPPSYRHLVEYYRNLKSLRGVAIVATPVFKNMIQNIIRNEKELIDRGYDVYYHGTEGDNNLLSDIYMMIYSYKSGKEPKNFRFLHFDDPVLGKVSERFFKSEEDTRKLLLAEGTNVSFRTDLKDALGLGRRTLFLAKFLFGNLNGAGCCPMYFVLNNFNWGNKDLSMQEIFSMFGYSDIYRMYESELLQLKNKHNNLSKFGDLVQIAIPKDDVNECVYQSVIGYHGQKEAPFNIPGVGKTTDMRIISDYVNKNPNDSFESILIMTRDKLGGLSPDSGKKTFFYEPVDPAKMAAYNEEKKPLLARILESCKQKDEREKQEAIKLENAKIVIE